MADVLHPRPTGVGDTPSTLTLGQAFARYEEIRPRLPRARPAASARAAGDLRDTFAHYDGYLFDSFGVLNVGETVIDGAADRLHALRAMGKPFCILTNAASHTSVEAHRKYRGLGLDVRPSEVISSRDVAFSRLADLGPGIHWAAIAAAGDDFSDTRASVVDLLADDARWSAAEGFLFLSSSRWTPALQERLIDELCRRPRPVVIANPDLVAPRETGLTIEPGFWAHDLQDRTRLAPHFFGKPYADAFRIAAARLGGERLAMVGDTLHTDILGGQAYGTDTVLVTAHGLFAGEPVERYMQTSSIRPTWILPSI